MDDETLFEFYRFIKSLNKSTTWAHSFVEALTDEVVRLRTKYEGFVYTEGDNK